MAALQSFGLDAVTSQPAVELGTDEYAVLRDGMARRLNCEGAVVYGCNEAGVVVRMWKQRSHAYAMERAAQEAIVTHRLCGVALRSRLAGKLARLPEEVRRCLGDWEAERLDYLVRFAAWLHLTRRQTGERTLRAAGPVPPMDHAAKPVHAVCRRPCARAVPSDALRAVR
ncbi:hypothetical protein C3747_265g27 [Trypanosoma cruzi]|uniref:DUF7920 domain-containing protein n=1 Tax=Trypanosoma cruzi TaxID=5693 RepID=A0A2V2VH15_TRYCR|nr:hypothetical protein C3747_265g27 [Trypanosoma cruzi]